MQSTVSSVVERLLAQLTADPSTQKILAKNRTLCRMTRMILKAFNKFVTQNRWSNETVGTIQRDARI
jgi:hypothetical protein